MLRESVTLGDHSFGGERHRVRLWFPVRAANQLSSGGLW
jgi:hypothetical protein